MVLTISYIYFYIISQNVYRQIILTIGIQNTIKYNIMYSGFSFNIIILLFW